MTNAGASIRWALDSAHLSQRDLAKKTGISQSTVSRIVNGQRAAKLPELVLIAQATGHTLSQLTGSTAVADRLQYAARSTNGSEMATMREALQRFAELNDYLDDQAVLAPS